MRVLTIANLRHRKQALLGDSLVLIVLCEEDCYAGMCQGSSVPLASPLVGDSLGDFASIAPGLARSIYFIQVYFVPWVSLLPLVLWCLGKLQ